MVMVTVALAFGAAATADETTPTTPTTTTPTTTTTTTTTVPATRVERFQAPGEASEPAERSNGPFQLTEPPPIPTTTTTTTTTLPPPNVLPANSGAGRRIVYSKSNQWVWLIEADGRIVKDHQVSGNRQWNLPRVGTYQVSSKSMHTCSIENPSLCWRYMVRFARGPNATWRDNIGFHEIPININSGAPVQGEWQLGEPLSGGCIRQATPDAVFLWNWTPVGTTVVVLG